MMIENLDCKKTEKLIPQFIAGKLDLNDKLMLIEHFENCSGCKDELNVQYMVSVGVNNLDEIIDLNIDRELLRQKKDILHKLHVNDIIERSSLGILFTAVSVFTFIVLLIIF